MSFIALLTWIGAGGLGLYLLSIWLIEYDKDYQAATATRLPPAILASHVLLAVGGLAVWVAYLILDSSQVAWTALAMLVMTATLGLTMAIRWLGVYRVTRAARQVVRLAMVSPGGGDIQELERAAREGPPERNFPMPVVVAHGIFAILTITLVLLTALGVAGS